MSHICSLQAWKDVMSFGDEADGTGLIATLYVILKTRQREASYRFMDTIS